MYTDSNEKLYELMQANPNLRKTLTRCYREGEKEIANEMIKSLGIATNIDSFMTYLASR